MKPIQLTQLSLPDRAGWAGPVAWANGRLVAVKGNKYWPVGRELLYFHRPEKRFDVPEKIRRPLVRDMVQYGYLLPNWIPLLSRFACWEISSWANTATAMEKYAPYVSKCFGNKEADEQELEGSEDESSAAGRSA